MPRVNQAETKEGTGATAGLPAPQGKLGPQQKDPRPSKLRELDMRIQGSQNSPTSGMMNAKWRTWSSTRVSINLN